MRAILLLALLPLWAEAAIVSECGTYDVEGYYTQIEPRGRHGMPKKVILLERGSNSEVRFYIANRDVSKLIPDTHLSVNFKLKLKFLSACFYECEGEIVDVVEPLPPFQPPKPFLFPRPKPIKGTELKCRPNSFEQH